MTHKDIISTTIAFVKAQLAFAEGGHDWFHIERVWKNAKKISSSYKSDQIDLMVVELAALLHDIADSKFHDGDESIGPKVAAHYMSQIDITDEQRFHVIAIIKNISFKGGKVERTFSSLELDITQDADRLDALGAVGIARTFNYGGFKNMAIYDPAIKPNLSQSKEEYKSSKAPTINHFYEKLLLLKDRMNTDMGRKMALERHNFMEAYLTQFYKECNSDE